MPRFRAWRQRLKPLAPFAKGARIEVEAEDGKWYAATVTAQRGEKVTFIYDGATKPSSSWIDFIRAEPVKATKAKAPAKMATVETPEQKASETVVAPTPAGVKPAEKTVIPKNATPVEAAILPLKKEAIERADQNTRQQIDRVLKKLEEVDWDADKVAPYPKAWGMSREDYKKAKSKHDLFRAVTKPKNDKGGWRRPGEPDTREPDTEAIERWVNNARDGAAAQYDAFVAKLNGKVGPHTDAKITGSHVWGSSILHVTKPDGTTERWKTQQIVNQSGLGTLFNQWPSRKIK